MKKNFALLFVLAFLEACSGSKVSRTPDVAKDEATLNHQTNTLIKKFSPIIQGYWIRKDYLEKIIRTKSPLAASDLVEAAEVEINTNDIKGDSLNVPVGDNHETGNSTLKFIAGKKPNTLDFNGEDLSYSINNGDTTLRLAFGDGTEKGMTFYTYVRAYKKLDHDFGDSLDEYMDNILIAGDYYLLNHNNAGQIVHFYKNGSVSGFLDLDKFFVNYDLNSDVNDNLDGMYFKGPNKEQMNFTFKIAADTLKLYDTRENADSTKLLVGELKYQFVRQH